MRYRLISGSTNDIDNVKEVVLKNRGIENPNEYLNLSDDCIHHYSLLDNMQDAVGCLMGHIENSSDIHIVVDCDADGNTSASILYNYLKLIDQNINLTYSIHTGKQHGLSKDIEIPSDVKLVIIPDAATNDIEQCKELKNKGIDIIILDHHMADSKNEHAIIVNNQTCDYPNKSLSAAGIVYKFIQAIDEETWNNYADRFLDLVALGNIADCMSLKSYETKRLIDKGISNIKNKFFKALVEKQSYSMNNTVSINSVQFYIVPLINAMIRSGDYEEKEMMFRAFIETDESFKYKPRRKSKNDPEPEEIDESIYDRVARLCANAKARQNKSKDIGLEKIYDFINEKGLDKNKIIFANVTELLDETLTGVTAIKVAERYNAPCLLLRRQKDNPDLYGGSGRNIDGSPIEDLKSFLESTGIFEYATGHPNAFGVGIKRENIKSAIDRINELLKDTDFSHCYDVDFILEIEDLDVGFIRDLNDLKGCYGQGIKEPYIVIKGLEIKKENLQLMGKTSDTWKFLYNDEIAFVKFKCKEDDEVLKWMSAWDGEDSLTIDLIGKASINIFGSIMTPQIVIEKYEVRKD